MRAWSHAESNQRITGTHQDRLVARYFEVSHTVDSIR
jgi:hypothetical protein